MLVNFKIFNSFLGEKCGIIKEGRPILIGNTVPLAIAKEFADRSGSPLYQNKDNLEDFVLENKSLVKKGAEILNSEYQYGDSVQWAFAQQMPCRFERVPGEYLSRIGSRVSKVILDVGHNPQSLEKIFEKIKNEEAPGTRISVLFGCKDTKDYHTVNRVLSEKAEAVYFVVPPEKNR